MHSVSSSCPSKTGLIRLLMIIAVDVKSGQIHCDQCDDIVYHPKFDAMYLAATSAAEERETPFRGKEYLDVCE